MDYLLANRLTSGDIEFLNKTTIDYELVDSFGHGSSQPDSGWCDMATGARIVSAADRVRFINPSEKDLTFLLLKYQDRLKKIVPTK